MSELPPDVRSFLDAARPAHLADRGDRARTRKALAARLLLPPLGDAGSPAPPADAPPADAPPPVAPPAPLPPQALAPAPAPVAPPAAVAASSGALLAAKKVVVGAALFASGGASTIVYERVASEPTHVAVAASAAPSSGRGPWRAPPRRTGRPEAIALDDDFAGVDAAPVQAEPPEGAAELAVPPALAAEAIASVAPAAPEVVPPGVVAGVRPGKRGENAANVLGSKGENEAPASVASSPGLAPSLLGSAALPPGPIASPSGSVAASAAPNAASTVAEELRLVRAAQAQLSAGRAEGALATLAEHARLYPQGALREERAAARVLALCALGRGEQAKREADAFVRVAPHSPYAGGLRRPCEGARGR
jgi:hypothetical protein